jgi:hypothetical protein
MLDNPEVLVGAVSVLLATATFLGTLGRSTFFNAGKLVTELQESRSEVQKQLQLIWSKLDKIECRQEEMQQQILSVYRLSPEEARRYLHYHAKDGSVCTD